VEKNWAKGGLCLRSFIAERAYHAVPLPVPPQKKTDGWHLFLVEREEWGGKKKLNLKPVRKSIKTGQMGEEFQWNRNNRLRRLWVVGLSREEGKKKP